MAIGFGATYGAGTTDQVIVPLTTSSNNNYTFAVHYFRNVSGGSSLGRVFANFRIFLYWDNNFNDMYFGGGYNDSGASVNIDFYNISDGTSGSDARGGSTGKWYKCVLTMRLETDFNAPTNVKWFMDGVKKNITKAPDVTGGSAPSYMAIGNRYETSDRNWDGIIQEFAVWNRILSDDECISISKGFSPITNLNGLTNYVPLVRNIQDYKNNTGVSSTGTKVQPHNRIIK
jgi:hypothetical protein